MTDRESPRRRRVPGVARPALLAASVLLLSACAGENNQNTFNPAGPSAHKINNLFLPIAIAATVVCVGVVVATFVVAWRFRHRPGNENPRQLHGSTALEIGWTVVPALILAIIAVPTVSTIWTLAKEPTGDVLNVTVTGKQWWWQYEYDREKVVTANELVIPAGRPVRLELKSDNVVHSFWVPELAGKQDVIPGRNQKLVIEADEPGLYKGQCAEYCGLAHADMRLRVRAVSEADFRTWIRDQQQGPSQPYKGEIAELTGKRFECVNCHVFDDSSKAVYGPNLTHLRSRETFAGATEELNRENLIGWLLDAPSRVPMQAKRCRVGLAPDTDCVGMPSFTQHTPEGKPVMTRAEAETIADWLLEER
ncbi:MAG: cytochrome c oxidase subunit II [Acidimicrobiia bacterium]|nr:cytochrome c oxidase subunit II [Acidimicrobiia bacterium]